MELFSLLAKLTLDTKEYDRAIQSLERDRIELPDAEVGLNASSFYDTVSDVEDTDIQDPEDPSVDLNTDDYKKSLDEAEADTESWSGAVGDIFEGLKGLLVASGLATAVAGVISSLSDAVDLARSMGDNIDKSSRAMSISTDAYQEWSHVLDINGASITDLNRGLMNMRKAIGGGDVSDEFSEAMDALGLSAKIANGEISTTEDLLTASMKALADFSGDAATRDVLTMAIFGRNGTKLNAMLDGSSKDIDALIQQAHELGMVMSEEEIANAAAYNDAVSNLEGAITAFKTSVVSELIPGLTDAANTLAYIVAMFNFRSGDDTTLSDRLAKIDEEGAKALLTMDMNEATAHSLIDSLAGMGDYWTLDDTGKQTWNALAKELITLFPQLDTVLENDKKAIQNNTAAIHANIEEWAKLEKQRILDQNLADKRSEIAKQYAAALEKEIQADVKENEVAGQRVKAIHDLNAALDQEANSMEAQAKAREEYGRTYEDQNAINEAEALRKRAEYFKSLKVGEDADLDAFQESLTALALAIGETDVDKFNKIKDIGSGWSTNIQVAQKLREEAQALTEEADKAQAEYEKFAAALEARLQGTAEETKTATGEVEALDKALEDLPDQKTVHVDVETQGILDMFNPFKNAKGNWSVPYDNYPALLHRDEMVLTKSQARQYRDNSGGMDSGAIVSAIQGLRNDMTNLKLVVGKKTFGRAVADYGSDRVNDSIGGAESRLAAGYGT